MKIRCIIFLAIVCCFTINAHADKRYVLNATALSLLSVDWLQTRYIAQKDNGLYEGNILLGRNPSKSAIDTYFLLSSIIVVETSYLLPRRWGERFLKSVIAIQASYVAHNYSIGIRVRL